MLLWLFDYLFGFLISLISWKDLVGLGRKENGFPADMVTRHQHRNWLEDPLPWAIVEYCAYLSVFLFLIPQQKYCCRLSIPRIKDPRDCSFLYFSDVYHVYMFIDTEQSETRDSDWFLKRLAPIVFTELL